MFLSFLARILVRQTSILKELYTVSIQLDALSTAVDNAVAKLATNAAEKATIQTALDQAHADLAAAQAKVDALTAKLTAA